MARQRESLFSDKVKRFLDTLPYTWHFRLPAVLAGLPDRIACVNGTFVALEIKTSAKAKRSKLQEYILGSIANAGGYARFVSPENFEEVKSHLESLVCRTELSISEKRVQTSIKTASLQPMTAPLLKRKVRARKKEN